MSNVNPYASPRDDRNPSDSLAGARDYPHRPMHFWSIEQLKAEMRAGPLADREALPYLVASVTLSAIAMGLPTSDFNLWDGLNSVWTVVLAIFGTIYVFRQNAGIDGQFFLQRYFAIGWVVSIRCLAMIVVASIAFFFVMDFMGLSTDDTNGFDFLFIALAETCIYWRIGHHVHDLAAGSTASRDAARR